MKRIMLFSAVSFIVLCGSGCVTTRQVSYDVNLLKNQVASLENAVARHNLLVQQNKNDIAVIADKTNQVAMEVSQLRGKVHSVSSVSPSSSMSFNNYSVPSSSGTDDVLSDKLKANPSINDVQRALQNAGFYNGAIDGKAGAGTRGAVVKFQKANGLKAYGIIGNQTWAELKKYL